MYFLMWVSVAGQMSLRERSGMPAVRDRRACAEKYCSVSGQAGL